MTWLLEHRLCRRLISMPLIVLLAIVMATSVPLWLPLSWLLGLLYPPARAAWRCLAFITLYLLYECVGLAVSAWLWFRYPVMGRDHQDYLRANGALQSWWANALCRSAKWLFRLQFDVTGEEALNGPGAIVLPRHTSIGDTLLPMYVYTIPQELNVRYVLKRELLLDPCLDTAGHRLPNVFLNRAAEDMSPELQSLTELAANAGNDAIVLYVEGTRFSEQKRQQLLRRLIEKGNSAAADRAKAWTHVLPPRPAGALALMDAAPEKDLLFFAHHGFEGAASFASLFNGSWLNTTVKMHFWRVPAAELPSDDHARRELLFDQWQRMQDCIEEMRKR